MNVLVTIIALEYSVQDGLHLNKVGRKCLGNYLINSLNAYILCNKKACKIIRDPVQAICTANKETINLKGLENVSSLNGLYQSLLHNMYNFTTRNIIINSFSAKFDWVKNVLWKNIDILVIEKTKFDNTFPLGLLNAEELSMPFRFDRNRNGWGVMKDLPNKILENISYLMILKIYLLNWVFRKVKFGYFL